MTETAPAARVAVGAGLGTALAILVAWNVVGRPTLPDRWHLLGSLLVAGSVLVVARVARLSWAELGLGRDDLCSDSLRHLELAPSLHL